MKKLLANLYKIIEIPIVYDFMQRSNPSTVGLYKRCLQENVLVSSGDKLLDIGCGTAQYVELFSGVNYYGVDVNLDYLDSSNKSKRGWFAVMSGNKLAFSNHQFDGIFTVAALHHMSDSEVSELVFEALRVLKPGGTIHLIDPVLPEKFLESPLNSIIFHLDRGCCPRKGSHMKNLLQSDFHIEHFEIIKNFPHNVCYARVTAKP